MGVTNISKPDKIKLYTFWSIIGLLTIGFIVTIIIMIVQLKPIKSYDDIASNKLSLVGQEVFEQEEDYYVYIYNSNMDNNRMDGDKLEEVNPAIFNYFNFVKRYSKRNEITKIYGLDVNYFGNRSVVSNQNQINNVSRFSDLQVMENRMPILLRISQGTIVDWYSTANDIFRELQFAMDKIS